MSRLFAFALLLSLSLPVAALAGGRRPNEFQPQELTQQELDAKSQRGRVNTWAPTSEDIEPEKPFNWMFLGFTAVIIAVVLPFAVNAYKNMSSQLRDTEAAQPAEPPQRRKRPAAE